LIQIDQAQLNRDADRIFRAINRTAKVLKMDVDLLAKITAIYAIQSATKATEPGSKGTVKGMAKKYRFRPLVDIPKGEGVYYLTDDGSIFKSPKALSSGVVRKRSLKRIKKGIKAWSNKQKKFTYIPYPQGKKNESDPRFKIPFAGAAKAGWLSAYRRLDSKRQVDLGNDNKQSGKRYSRVVVSPGRIQIENLVRYAGKTSPAAARIGLSKAASKLENVWIPRAERRIERNWERGARSFVQALGSLS